MFVLQGCKKPASFDCFKSNGSETTETRTLDFFDHIEVQDKIEVVLVWGQEYKTEVTAGKNIIDKVLTDVENGILKIENRNKCNVVRGYKKHPIVTVTLPKLKTLVHNSVADLHFDKHFISDTIFVNVLSSGNVYMDGSFDFVKTESNGNGDLYISGSAKQLSLYTRGTNYVHAENLSVSEYARVETVSIGDVYLNGKALKKLQYYIGKSGNIYYSGSIPEIEGYAGEEATGKIINKN